MLGLAVMVDCCQEDGALDEAAGGAGDQLGGSRELSSCINSTCACWPIRRVISLVR